MSTRPIATPWLAWGLIVLFVFVAHATARAQASVANNELNRPLTIESTPLAVYTDEARAREVQGAVLLEIALLANGQVGDVEVLKDSKKLRKYGLTGKAITAARQIRFSPKTVNGRPVNVKIKREYTFVIY